MGSPPTVNALSTAGNAACSIGTEIGDKLCYLFRLQQTMDSTLVEVARLEAEQAGVPYAPAGDGPYDQLQLALYQKRQAEFKSSIANFDAQIQSGEETLKLVRTPDILEGLGARPQHPLLVGFAAETENVEQSAREKLARKNLDLIVANDVADAFGKDSNRVLVLGKDGARREIEGSKRTVAHAIWDMVRERLPG